METVVRELMYGTHVWFSAQKVWQGSEQSNGSSSESEPQLDAQHGSATFANTPMNSPEQHELDLITPENRMEIDANANNMYLIHLTIFAAKVQIIF